ncbi:MAG: putative transport system permease protein, partial [Pseudonocardiales bacterium]|nr:putative transport system permease protein [Pseudonocardiales bacterium]
MPALSIWLRGTVRARTGPTLATAAGVAIAVALLAAIGAFLAASKATMTSRAAATVTVDWQVQVATGTDPQAVLPAVRATPHVTDALPVGYAATTGLTTTTGATTQTTGPGVVLGIPDGYRQAFPDAQRSLAGAAEGVLLAQQTAANLHARVGDTISIGRAGLEPFTARVDGIVDLPQADALFQTISATGGSTIAPPDNVVLLPAATFGDAETPLAALDASAVRTQIHVRLDRQLPPDPAAAYSQVTAQAHNLEARLAGGAQVGDTLASTLSAARGDALYAQVLFLFLGFPGAALVALLTVAVAGASATRRRSEQALLRCRGATTSQLVAFGAAEAAVVGVVGAAGGLAIAAGVGQIAFGHAGFGATTAATITWAGGAALVGLVVAIAAVAIPARRDARAVSVTDARRQVSRSARVHRRRGAAALACLAGALIVFRITSRDGYQLVIAPEGTPAVSVSYWAFAGPALLWIAIGLLTWQVAELVLTRAPGVIRWLLRPVAGPLADTVASALRRQRRAVTRGAVLIALTLCFAASTSVFDATYQQQARVDALLSNGADVNVTHPPGAAIDPTEADRVRAVAGVARVEPIQHRYAYVGTDLQDLFGVDPQTIIAGTRLVDAYFTGASATDLVGGLAARPDGLLVSQETVRDFQLQPGDLVRLRLQNSTTQQYTEVAFHYIGIVTEFPTAPRDSFLVANASYIAAQTGNGSSGTLLVTTDGASPPAVAARVRDTVGSTATVTDIGATNRLVGSSLT